MVGDSVTTVINIVNYIFLDAYCRQSPKCKITFLDIAVGVVVSSLCPSPFKKVIYQQTQTVFIYQWRTT